MSFTFGISKTSTLVLAALACALTANHCAAGPHPSAAACGKYADKAWYSVQDMKKSGCAETGDMGPGRFSQSLKEHRDWCTNAATPETMVNPATFCLLYTSPSPRDGLLSRMPSSA